MAGGTARSGGIHPPSVTRTPHTALVLAGGQGRRMGRSKADLEFAGEPLLARVVRRLREGGFDDVRVVAAEGQSLPVVDAPVLCDRRPDCGPLGGLATGLAALDAPSVLLCACDLPFVSPELGRELLRLAEGCDAVVPRAERGPQPLFAAYSRRVLPLAEQAIAEGRLRMQDFLAALRVQWLDAKALRNVDPEGLALTNINTEQEWREALALAARLETVAGRSGDEGIPGTPDRHGAGAANAATGPVLTHLDESGSARMVDVSAKPVTARRAVAAGCIRMAPATIQAVRAQALPKGDVLTVAQIAGIIAAKRTSELIPLCHPLPLSQVHVRFRVTDDRIEIEGEAVTSAQTGVEMEALTAVTVAALTLYDMCKAIDREMVIDQVRLLEKTGGIHGDWKR